MTQIALSTIAVAVGLAAAASEPEVMTALAATATAAKDLKDPAKFVPAADLTAALARAATAETALATIKQQAGDKAAEALVDQAIADGKIPPVSKEHWVALAKDSREGVEKALGAMPKVLDTSKLSKPAGGETDANGLTPEQKALCRELSLDEKAFAANLKKETV